jgi:hypothetical protein
MKEKILLRQKDKIMRFSHTRAEGQFESRASQSASPNEGKLESVVLLKWRITKSPKAWGWSENLRSSLGLDMSWFLTTITIGLHCTMRNNIVQELVWGEIVDGGRWLYFAHESLIGC